MAPAAPAPGTVGGAAAGGVVGGLVAGGLGALAGSAAGAALGSRASSVCYLTWTSVCTHAVHRYPVHWAQEALPDWVQPRVRLLPWLHQAVSVNRLVSLLNERKYCIEADI